MALNATTLAAAIKTPTKTAYIACGAADNAALETLVTALSAAIAGAIVTHIQSNATLAVVTACPAGAGTGTGTIA